MAKTPLATTKSVATVPANERLLLDMQSAAEMLSMSDKVLVKLPIAQVKIPNIRRVFYRRVDLEEYVRSLAG